MKFRVLFDRITLSGLKDPNDIEMVRKVRMINLISMTGIVILITMGAVTIREERLLLLILDFSTAAVLIGNVVYFNRSKNYSVTSAIGVYFMAAFFFFFFLTGGSNRTGHLWSFTFPLFASFLLGSRRGAIASAVLLAASLISVSFSFSSDLIARYPLEFRIRFILSFLVVSVFAYVFERVRQTSQRQLKERNDDLRGANENLLSEVAERKQAQGEMIQAKEAAERANRAKSDFLANMSHELRTPLNHIIGFGELLGDDRLGELNETQKEYLEDVLQSARHLLSLINDILDLSKVEAGKMVLELSRFDLRGVLESSLTMIREKAIEQRIALDTDIQDIPHGITADERKLKQILYNLLANAVKFTPEGGKILLKAGMNGERELMVQISDSGIGIAREHLDLIFMSFQQLENTANRRFEGTGLGLALTRRMVELHGGTIRVESEGKGRGSCFSFTLPLLDWEERA